jgi:hypothetical protein
MPRQNSIKEILEKPFLTENDLERLGLRSRKTSQNLRSTGKEFLPYVRLGRKNGRQSIRYVASGVWEHLRKNKVMPDAQ